MSGKYAASPFADTDAHRHPALDKAQDFILIWLDSNIGRSGSNHESAIHLFRSVIENFHPFTDEKQCVRFIEKNADTQKICMVVSGSFGEHVVPRVHDMPQIDSIIVFCGNKQRHDQWARTWPKIKGVLTDLLTISQRLVMIVQQSAQSAALSNTAPIKYDKKLDQLDSSFMYTQIMKEIFLTIHFNQQHTEEFIDYCRQRFSDNAHELDNIQRFEEEYHDHSPVWWYTCNCFLPRIMNDALQKMDIDALIKMGFFIAGLHRQIEQLHAEQSKKHRSKHPLEVYRGQDMSRVDVAQLKQKRGGLWAFNQFLTADRDQQASLKSACEAAERSDSLAVLFIIRVEPSRSTVPFALTGELNYYSECNEILFSTHAVFRIHDIQSIDRSDRVFRVTMALTNDTDEDLRIQTDRLREELSEISDGWHKLAQLMSEMGHSSQAKALLRTLTEQTTDDTEESSHYEQLAEAKLQEKDYKHALELYEKVLEIDRKTDPPNLFKLARSYSNIGNVYRSMASYEKALKSYKKALEIRQKSLSSDDPDLASSYSDIGNVHESMNDYRKALSFHEKALTIQQKSLAPDHSAVKKSQKKIDDLKTKL